MIRLRSPAILAAGGVLLWGLLAIGPALGGPVPASTVGCAPGLSLSAQPTAGNAPLVVGFQLTVLGSAPTAIDWTFGDGSYFNGSGSAFYAPIHRFDHPGQYTTSVSVTQNGQTSGCSETLAVTSGPLQTVAYVAPKSGAAPLTVEFTAMVLGGSGTFRSATWVFGDGQAGSGFNLSYTYPGAGDYVATFQVTDSTNATSNSTLFVNVSAAAATRGPSVTASSWIVGGVLAGGVALFGGVLYARSLYAERGGRPERGAGRSVTVPATVFVEPAVSPPETATPTPSPSYLPPGGPSVRGPIPPSSRFPPTPARPTPMIEPALPPLTGPTPPPAPPAEERERMRLSQRLILHIYSLGTLRDDEIAPPTFTQAGMSEKLGVGQSPLSNVLRRLVIAGVLSQDVRHVRGRPRRLRVYRLTPMGESLAVELRQQREGATPNPPGRGPAN